MFDSTPLVTPVVRFPLGLIGGLLATLVMDRVMARVREGETPPTVAAGVLTQTHPDRAPERLATVVHYLAGLLTGPLFVYLLYLSEFVVGSSPLGVVAAGVVLFLLMVGFFVVVVLPRPDGLAPNRRGDIARGWAVSAAAYVLVLVPVVAVVPTVL
ncbi:MAG: hypothetical protein ABEH80_02765 [Halobaculum sp.]|jgi:hypothetical protein